MDVATRDMLTEMTKAFYQRHAEEFHESRKSPWNSWEEIFDTVFHEKAVRRVLDVGCGNGRFAGFLFDNSVGNVEYVGVDNNAELLELASAHYPKGEFHLGDIESDFGDWGAFDVIVCFGVMHHIPGVESRVHLMKQISTVLNKIGIAVFSFWQPKLLQNFDRKVGQDLGDNDYLLGWNGDFSELRYVHHFNEEEIEILIKESGLELVAQFNGTVNDASNRYVILQKTL